MHISAPWNCSHQISPLQLHSDVRGDLYEALRFTSQSVPPGGQFYVYTINPGHRRGDHYHLQKCEWFICISGQVRILIKTRDGQLVNQIIDSTNPQLVFVGPGSSHAVVNDSSTVACMVAYSSKEFDKLNPDTFHSLAD